MSVSLKPGAFVIFPLQNSPWRGQEISSLCSQLLCLGKGRKTAKKAEIQARDKEMFANTPPGGKAQMKFSPVS